VASGSGKRPLLRTLLAWKNSAESNLDQSERKLLNLPSEMDAIRKKIGMSFQGGASLWSMTVGEHVALPLREHTSSE